MEITVSKEKHESGESPVEGNKKIDLNVHKKLQHFMAYERGECVFAHFFFWDVI